MKKLCKFISVIFLLIIAVNTVGCTRKELYQASDIQVTKVEPFNILPTDTDFSSIEDGVITLQLINNVPCELVSYDIHYKTVVNEPIDSLAITNVMINIPLSESGSEVTVTLKPYSQQLLNLFNNSISSISPVRAIVTLHFKDVNKNEITKEAGFLLYKFEGTSTSE